MKNKVAKITEKLKALKLEWLFLIIALIFGSAIAIITPPGEAPDERQQMVRAYEVFSGKLIPEHEKTFPNSFHKVIVSKSAPADFDPVLLIEKLQVRLEPETTITSDAIHINYSFFIYLPQALGLAIGTLLDFPTYVIWVLCRLINLATFSTLVFFAIRQIPIGKWVIFVVALLPMSIYQAASNSSDAMLNGVGLFSIALLLRYGIGPVSEKPNQRYFWFIICAILLGLTKIHLLPILFIFLLANHLRKLQPKRYWLMISLGVFLCVFIVILMNVPILNASVPPINDVKPSDQLRFVLLEPFTFLETLFKTVVQFLSFYYRSFVGILGWLDTPLPDIIYLIYGGVLMLALLVDPFLKKFEQERLLLLGVFVGSTLILFLSLYLIATPVASPLIGGIQGRYFIPLVPLLLIPLITTHQQPIKREKVFKVMIACGVLVSLCLTILTIILRFYTVSGMGLIHFIQ